MNTPIMQECFIEAIKEMRMVDQKLRKADSGPEDTKAKQLGYLADQAHNRRLRRLIKEFGYPTKEMVGEEALKDFWLLVQHQDGDVKLQQDCFDNCDFDPIERAYLLDRLRANRGEEQEYGTQLRSNEDGNLEPMPIRDSENVDVRRNEIELESLSEYVDKSNAMGSKH